MTTNETEFTRSIKLLNRLNTEDFACERFENDPDTMLREFGIHGEEADRFKNRWEDGDLRVLGWRITQDYRVLSPWPMNEGDRTVRSVTPGTIDIDRDVELVIEGSRFRIGDRVGFRRQDVEGDGSGKRDFEAYDVDFVDPGRIIARVNISRTGVYDVAVGRLPSAGFLDAGLRVA